MAETPSRWVIINGVQTDRARALRSGMIDENGKIITAQKDPEADAAPTSPAGPKQSRARSSKSTRKG